MTNAVPDSERSRAQVEAEYAEQFPLFGAYRAIIVERNSRPVDLPITEPFDRPGSVDTLCGAQLALERIGHPSAGDELVVRMADAYICRLTDEVNHTMEHAEPTFLSVLVDQYYQFAGCIPTVEEWVEDSLDEQQSNVDELLDRMTPELTREAVRLAMPAILQQVIEQDQARIRRANIGLVAAIQEDDDV